MKGAAVLLAGLGLGPLFAQEAPDARESAPLPEKIHFSRDVRPILADTCFKCHGPDPKAREAGLRLDTREGALAPLEEGKFAVVPGQAGKSELVRRITAPNRDDRMPPLKSGKKLSPRQVALLTKWVEQGVDWQGHWAFVPPARPAPPAVRNAKWPRNPIDAFVLARLEKEGLAPSPEADRVTLVRRLSFDLTGLPPAPGDVESEGYEKLVDRLLASPHYGERMALYWLDLVRYGDSRGYHSDNPRNVAGYRDYVIAAFNDNVRFDRFTVEQLAGDLLQEPTLLQRTASGYNRLNLTTEEGGAQAREYEAKTAADRVRNVSGVWMGATLGCAECHDHKFDPYTTRDFYRFAAFFADIKESPIGDRDRGILYPDGKQAAELKKFDDEIALLKTRLDTPTPELAAAQAEWEKTALRPFPWTVLVPGTVKSSGGAAFYAEEDGSILVDGANPPKDTHTVVVNDLPPGVTGFRLEALAHPGLPSSGPGRSGNGNFVLTRFQVKAGEKDVALARAAADHSQDGYAVASALDAKAEGGWAVLPRTGRDHVAVFEPAAPVGAGRVAFLLEYKSSSGQHVIGRFRLSATAEPSPSKAAALPEKVRSALLIAREKRDDAQKKELAAHYRSIAPALDPARAELARVESRRAEFVKGVRTTLVSMAENPRTVRVLPRGNWMDVTGEAVTPGVPGFMGAVSTGDRRATRMDLAKWLASRQNPLTARVFVNRLWKLFFGQGVSKSLDDLGAQGEWPTHPELLDWLAVDFTESGWDVKRMVKLIVTSSAYRQSSTPTPALKERDPFNRLFARQSRWRLDAESVRDNALAVSGLLVRKVGGESVRPHQPAGYWAYLNFPKREWQNDKGPDAYRRGIYTWWQRTFPHPSLLAFDAPNREECCAERPRSNIPQQALVLLNDPTYVEAARVFAERIAREGGADPTGWAFRAAVSRKPSDGEAKLLLALHAKHLEAYRADPKAAEQLVKVGQAPVPKDIDPAELAAWTSVARAILNLHETITRY